MALDRDGSSVVLLSVNGKPAENNNMLETDTFQPMEYELKPDPVKVKKWTRVPFIIAWICVVCAVVCTIAAVVLVVRLTESKLEGNQTIPTPSLSSSTPQTPTSSPPLTSSYTIEPSFSQTYSSSSSVVSTTNVLSRTSSVIQSSIVTSSSAIMTSSSVVTSSTTSSSSSTTTSTTTTTTTITTTVKPCASGEFQCGDGLCIDASLYCDGKPQCPTADDEPKNCKCSGSQFMCSSGQCIPSRFRCDGVPQCMDKTDEFNCSNCRGFECVSGQCLWTSSTKCNGMIDCDDLSDEVPGCAWRPYHERCKNGMLIHRDKFCDGVDDCFDNSDEEDCGSDYININGERMCGDWSTSILHEWWCDGYPDCPDGSDEDPSSCGSCKAGQFQCSDYSCIDVNKACDGTKDCASGSDEDACVKLQSGNSISPGFVSLDGAGVVMVTSNQQQLPVCSDNWSARATDDICAYLGKGSGSGHTFVPMATADVSDGFMKLTGSGASLPENQTVLSLFSKRLECSSGTVVAVTCDGQGCGSRQVDLVTPFIVGGSLPQLGKWPWVVSLQLLGEYVCSGVLLDNSWVLTAAHCIVTGVANYTLTPHYYTVLLGAVSVQNPGSQAQVRTLDRIVVHPGARRLMSGVTDWDLALLHLDQPVAYTDYIQAVCLPSPHTSLPTNSQCYLAGWGYINTQKVTVDKLRDAKFRLWGDKDCKANIVDQESQVNINSTLCAGYQTGLISACQGDSGGPLMCQVLGNRWLVAGVMSSGTQGCDGQQAFKANRFARVTSSVDWITSVIHPSR